MPGFQVLTASEQVAKHLKEELLRGTWVGLMPGEDRLMAHLGIGRNTAAQALKLLEQDGYILSRGAGCRRKITLPKNHPTQSMRVGILLYDSADRQLPRTNHLLQRLLEAGHRPSIAGGTLESLKMKTERVASFAGDHSFDAWVVCSAPGDILEWFSQQGTPAFALYGNWANVPIAAVGAHKILKVMDLIQEIVNMGHRRIVKISRKERVTPKPGGFEQAFLDKLESCGIPTSDYNLPIWDIEPKKLHKTLDSLFKHTPPTAIYIGEHQLFLAIQHYLANMGVMSPRDVSLICGEPHVSFPWMNPTVTHFDWDEDRIVQCAIRWINNIAKGKQDLKQTMVNSKLVSGGTIGPPPAPHR